MPEPMKLKKMDYSVVQQCMHCGMCLPTCPTYQETLDEKNSPRGRIAWMRAIADERLPLDKDFGDEMYYCLGCLACVSACPAGVDYPKLFEAARADVEDAGVLPGKTRQFWRWFTLRFLFLHPRRLRFVGFSLRLWQRSGGEALFRRLRLNRLLPQPFRRLEPRSPRIAGQFSDALIAPVTPARPEERGKVGFLTGCIQDLVYSEVNRDSVSVLSAFGFTVITPRQQVCCGSLHGHNGDMEAARELARRTIDSFDLGEVDFIVSNAGGCGSHLRHYGPLLANDPNYAERAKIWDSKVRDIHELLAATPFPGNPPKQGSAVPVVATYHDSCHLRHGQKVAGAPRLLLDRVSGFQWVPLPEADWCCGSAGIYSITQPDQSEKLLQRKLDWIEATGAKVLATANPGCHLQLENGARERGLAIRVVHPMTLLAESLARNSHQMGQRRI
jgi:glycolate oxidase iron-sulfur subunit